MASQQELQALENQRKGIQRELERQSSVLEPLENKVNQDISLTAIETQLYNNTQNAISALENSLAQVRADIVAMKTELGRYVPPGSNNTSNASDVVNEDPFAAGADVTDTVPETAIRRDSITQQVGQDTINLSELDPNAVRQFSQEELSSLLNNTGLAINSIEALPSRERFSPEIQQSLNVLEARFDVLLAETRRRANAGEAVGPPKRTPDPVDEPDLGDAADETLPVELPEEAAQSNQAALERLRRQSAAQQQREPNNTGDWRVRLRLASGANYFYRQPNVAAGLGPNGPGGIIDGAGIMRPLLATDGIVFPYTPSIQILYAAEYNTYQPTHSNYQQYFYKGSKVGEVVLTANFTAQDTEEADYLLAVIHFLKSASKMFYGQDSQRGSPPPLLFLTGLGDYQFNEAPCVISQFNYVLPDDVDYIRSGVSQIRAGQTLQTNLRNKNSGDALTSWSSSINRVLNTPGLSFGAEKNLTAKVSKQTANLSSDKATYVPTKLQMTITLLPVQNRLQVSKDFSLKDYANGSLIKGGYW